ncbi:MAG: flagellin FliC [Myxococcales bacterium]|nr:flagellin FliC [Myxococcales bacterium]
MALYIQTNYSSMVAQTNLSSTQTQMQTTFARLASGFRINGAADDAAGLGIAESFNAQVRSYAVAERNANDGVSMAQVADGAAGQISNILGRMRELAVQSSNGDLSTNDRSNLDTEFQALSGEIDRIGNVTSFNGTNLLAGAAATVDFQVGIGTSSDDRITVSFNGADTTELGVNGLDVTNFANSQAAITALDTGIQNLSTVRAGFGAAINQLQGAVSNLQSTKANMSASLGRIRDVDVASETANLAKQQVLSQAGISVLSQANQSPQLALSLLRG